MTIEWTRNQVEETLRLRLEQLDDENLALVFVSLMGGTLRATGDGTFARTTDEEATRPIR